MTLLNQLYTCLLYTSVSPFNVEPGKFTYRLVRGELEYKQLGTIEAHCRLLPDGQTTTVPLTLLPPLGG